MSEASRLLLFSGNIVDSTGGDKKRPRLRRPQPPPPPPVGVAQEHVIVQQVESQRDIQSSDPLGRLCEQLLNWPLIKLIRDDRQSKDSDGAIDNGDELPLRYANVFEYAEKWERWSIEEMKANILSSVTTQSMEKMVSVSIDPMSSLGKATSVIRLACRADTSQSKSESALR